MFLAFFVKYIVYFFKNKLKFFLFCVSISISGVWLSLVERYVRDVEAAGSNPVTSTTAHIIAASPTASVLLEL